LTFCALPTSISGFGCMGFFSRLIFDLGAGAWCMPAIAVSMRSTRQT
jgi:hypothetical protein